MAEGAPADVSSLRLVSSGGANVTPAFVEETSRTFGCRVKRTYGSTEAPTVTTSTDDDPFDKARDTDGRAVGQVELRISDPASGARCPTGSPGELWVRGPEMFAGYADAASTAAVIAPGGWFRTGDLATIDADGWVRIVGRLKDVIIRGGENISASEVEAALEAHPEVHHAVAVGYPDPLMGERVAAFVETTAPFDLEECRRWFAHRGMAVFKTPEKVVALERLPLLGSGKADRAELRRRAAARDGGLGPADRGQLAWGPCPAGTSSPCCCWPCSRSWRSCSPSWPSPRSRPSPSCSTAPPARWARRRHSRAPDAGPRVLLGQGPAGVEARPQDPGDAVPVEGGVTEADLIELGPLQVQVHVVLPGEADAAVDLQPGRHHPARGVGSPRLGHGGRQRASLSPAAAHQAA